MRKNMKVVLFDIDGTLANIDHRRPILEKDPHNWKDFFTAIGDDIPNQEIVDLYKIVCASNHYECIIVSGRPEQYRQVTEQWLTWNHISFYRLMLRPENDQRPDHVIKEEILSKLNDEGKKISFVVDDRQSVVDMWRRNGIVCLQCAEFKG